MKAKGLSKLKIHSKDAGRYLYSAVNPRLPQKTVRRNTTRPVRKDFFTKMLIKKAKAIKDNPYRRKRPKTTMKPDKMINSVDFITSAKKRAIMKMKPA